MGQTSPPQTNPYLFEIHDPDFYSHQHGALEARAEKMLVQTQSEIHQ